MVTKQKLEKRIEKYKEEITKLGSESKKEDRRGLRTFRKRLKRAQRKLAAVVHNEERVAVKGEAGKKD